MSDNYYALNISLTEKCNLNCKHCGLECDNIKNQNKSEMSFDTIAKIIHDAKRLTFKHIIFSGGEPFLRKDLFDIFDVCEKENISFSILTNGTMIQEEKCKILKKYKMLIYVRVSLDFDDAEKMDEFRGITGIFDRVKYAIGLLDSYGIVCGVGMTIIPENVERVKNVAKIARDYGADFFRAVPVLSIGRAKTMRLDGEFYLKALFNMIEARKIAKLEEQYRVLLLPEQLKETASWFVLPCNGAKSIAAISSEGKVSRCPVSTDYVENMSVNDSELETILKENIQKYNFDKQKILKGIKCKGCESFSKCEGGCLCEIEYTDGNSHCIKHLLERVLEYSGEDKEKRRVINNIICRYSTQKYYNIPCCVRSSPLWTFPLKIRRLQ